MHEGRKSNSGCVEVICGSMFSGKTEELQRRIRRARIAGMSCMLFKPSLDNRYHQENIVSHTNQSEHALSVKTATEIINLSIGADVVGIDEAQFFDKDILEVTSKMANQGVRVIISGLDTDFRNRPFGPMPELMAVAEYVTKLHAICVQCGELAHFTYRKAGGNQQIKLGAQGEYEARCRACFLQDAKK